MRLWIVGLTTVLAAHAANAQLADLFGKQRNHCGVEVSDLSKLGGAWVTLDLPPGQEAGSFVPLGCRLCSPPMAVTFQTMLSKAQPPTSDDLVAALYADQAKQRIFLDGYLAMLSEAEPGCRHKR